MCLSVMGPTLTREMMTNGRPLHLALYDEYSKIVQLLEYEVSVDARTELASESGQLEVVQVLPDHGADVDIGLMRHHPRWLLG